MDVHVPVIGDVAVEGILFESVVVLGLAVVFGLLARALGQSPFVGYLLAGIVAGPAVLDVVADHATFSIIGEVGVALLLFAIGLELPWQRLHSIGRLAAIGGVLQMAVTAALTAIAVWGFGADVTVAVAAGLAVSLSSTAVVLRVLVDRGELDSSQGRAALGVLLAQDIATVVFVVAVQQLGGDLSRGAVASGAGESLLKILLLTAGLVLADRIALRPLLSAAAASSDREFLSMISIVVSLGAIGVADALGLSPAVGGFVAGVVIGDAPYSGRVRSEIAPLRTALVALFFADVGMLVDLGWVADNLFLVAAAALAVMTVKPVIAAAALRVAGIGWTSAVLAGVALGQLGEFSFVVAGAGVASGVFGDEEFQLFVAVSFVTLIATPWLVAGSTGWLARHRSRSSQGMGGVAPDATAPEMSGHVVVIGAGTTGTHVAQQLCGRGIAVAIIDLHPRLVEVSGAAARSFVGDAAHADVLAETGLGLAHARAAIVTVPDSGTARAVIHAARAVNPHVPIIVRGRHHQSVDSLARAGASDVVDEELELATALVSAGERVIEAGGKPV